MTPEQWRQHFATLAANGDQIEAAAYFNSGTKCTNEQIDLMAEDIRRKLLLSGDERLLDVGCAGGLMLDRLAPAVREVVGVDICEESLALARQRGHKVMVADASNRLPFEDGEFDRVLCHAVVMCMSHQDTERAIAEMLRVTKPGGMVMLSDVADATSREGYWNYTGGSPLPKLWGLRLMARRLADRLGVRLHREVPLTDQTFFFPRWFWDVVHGVEPKAKVELLRDRDPPSGRGTDPFRYEIRIRK